MGIDYLAYVLIGVVIYMIGILVIPNFSFWKRAKPHKSDRIFYLFLFTVCCIFWIIALPITFVFLLGYIFIRYIITPTVKFMERNEK